METDRTPIKDVDRTREVFAGVKQFVVGCGVLSAAVLVVVVALSVGGHEVTPFMWGRAGGMVTSAAVIYWLTVVASRGARWAYLRVRIISVVVPIAVIALDSIPGALPLWFVVVQVAGALALVPAAFLVNGAGARAALRK